MSNNQQKSNLLPQRKIFACYYWGCTILWMIVIFCFSAHPHSDVVTKQIFHDLNYCARKLAHMSEFGFLYFLCFRAVSMSQTDGNHPIRVDLVAFLICILYAISDEWHQSFVPGRSAQITDVLIDGIGIMITFSILHLPGRHRGNWKEPEQA